MPGPAASERWRPWRECPARAAFFLDFDGTLAPIVTDPAGAVPLPGVPALLGRLSRRFGLVAVVSGRPLSYLRRALAAPGGVRLAGLYGMEAVGPDGQVQVPAELDRWRPVVAAVTVAAATDAPAGLEVEAKGLSVTLHWRNAPERAGWARRFAESAAAEHDLVAQSGRMSIELRPPVAADKGTVVADWSAGFEAVACFGDDLGDLPAFAALDRLAADGVAVVRVAVADPETPPEVVAAADQVVEGPAGALALLTVLAEGS